MHSHQLQVTLSCSLFVICNVALTKPIDGFYASIHTHFKELYIYIYVCMITCLSFANYPVAFSLMTKMVILSIKTWVWAHNQHRLNKEKFFRWKSIPLLLFVWRSIPALFSCFSFSITVHVDRILWIVQAMYCHLILSEVLTADLLTSFSLPVS